MKFCKECQREHEEIAFCEDCGACVRSCLGGASFKEPIEKVRGSGIITHIDRSKCIESLLKNNYCSMCLKVCPQGKKT